MYKTLAKSMRQYIKPSILTMIFLAGEVFAEMMIPYLMAKVLDRGFETKDIQYIIQIGLLMAVLALISMTCGILGGKFSSDASAGFAANLREDIYRNIQRFSFQNIDRFSTPSLITRLTTDITNIQFAFQMVLKTVIRAPFMIVFAFIMAAYTNLKLSMIILAVIPFLGAALIFLIYRVHPYFVKVFRQYDHLNQTVQEVINGVRVVKSFVREEKEIDRFKEASEQIKQVFMKAEKLIALNSPIMQIAVYSSLLVVYWFGAKFVVAGSLTPGTLTSFIMYMLQILNSLMMFSMIFVMIVISEASCERVAEVLTEKSTLTNPENPVTTIENGEIEFKNVSFKYYPEAQEADLTNISFKIESGQTIGIIGGTGSGKSSLIQLIPRLYDTTQGEVYVAGRNVKEYDLVTLRDQIAMVLQKNTLFSGTILENLRWGDKDASLAEVKRMASLAQADQFVSTFPEEYNTILDQGGNNVSGGQKQRLTIARALLKKPKILILDDSTSAVDTKTDAKIRQAFKEEIPNTTKIIVAQRVSSIQDADKIIVLDEGKINGIGTHEELLANNQIYQEVYESQVKGGRISE
ncbi:ABC transporter ATP-binding protein/permease [Enterococcus cecorum]|uniref:ABC transporter ATP-binding protein n=1 Tax=Enterococcus cecorum TaxID=44008 RepID=UPI001FAE0613|nr:ABC transporter ATP-binding protein [Enterococcus cecorum]MCJ0553077.1 ABC transporter ATP-binding protein/permease [Enterococcus cecorum]MCJ0557452.1 ABC transporter ATP-binding protein/permease [Enterococcus cecorum]MCJ0562088.1 ABC transporter ATP-binding protein/permease [Enterococcus cecorum]MCJ0564930.1 ABC transporter ATP-binding protein/permease [Enterococcus cecorum]MCJ0597458.1 ABC transporter ATP-binding protein/permease [Enterococcus cecorum]